MAEATTQTKWVYDFAEGSRDMRELLGGKGANVAEMTRILGPERVPAGFTITTEACVAYMQAGREEPDGLAEQVDEALDAPGGARRQAARRRRDPLLVSVRSGARESMPGMLDTVLNLGLNDESVEGLARATGNERFAWDSYRRFVQMFGNVVARHPRRALRGRDRGGQGRARREARHRARRRRAAGARRRALPGASTSSRRTRGAAAAGDPRGVRLLDGRARGRLPAPQPHPRRVGHGGQRPADGVRQQGRHVGLRRRLQPRRGHRRARAVGRLPRQRPGRGRRLRRAQHARHRRAGARSCPRRTRS